MANQKNEKESGEIQTRLDAIAKEKRLMVEFVEVTFRIYEPAGAFVQILLSE